MNPSVTNNESRRQSLTLEDILDGDINEDAVDDCYGSSSEVVFFPSSFKKSNQFNDSRQHTELLMDNEKSNKGSTMDQNYSKRQQQQPFLLLSSGSERSFHAPLPHLQVGHFEKQQRAVSESPSSSSLWTSVGAAATEWFTFNEDELAEIQKKQDERLELKRLQEASEAENRRLRQEQKRLQQLQNEDQSIVDRLGPLMSRRGSKSEKDKNKNHAGGRRGFALIGKSGRIVMNLVRSGIVGNNINDLDNRNHSSSLKLGAAVDEIQVIRRDICKTRKAVHDAVAEMDTGSQDWKKLQRALRQQNAYTNAGAYVALGHLIVDAALHQENVPVSPLRNHHSLRRWRDHHNVGNSVTVGTPRRGSTGRRACFAATKLAKLTKEHLSQSLSHTSYSSHASRCNVQGIKTDGEGTCPSLMASMDLSMADQESSDHINDALEESFSLHELLQTASTKRLEAMFVSDENGIDQRTGQHLCYRRCASLDPRAQASMKNTNSSTDSFYSAAASWNEFDVRMAQISSGNKGPTWVVVDRKFSRRLGQPTSISGNRVGSESSASSENISQFDVRCNCQGQEKKFAVSHDRRRHSSCEESSLSAPTIVGRARGALARRMTGSTSQNAPPVIRTWNSNMLSADLSRDVITEFDLAEEEQKSAPRQNPGVRRRRGALTGAPEDEVQKEIATVLYAKRCHHSSSFADKFGDDSIGHCASEQIHEEEHDVSEQSGSNNPVDESVLVSRLPFGSLPRKKSIMAYQA